MCPRKQILLILFSMRLILFLDQALTQSRQSLRVKSRIKNGVLILEFNRSKKNQLKWALIAHVLFNLIHLQDMS